MPFNDLKETIMKKNFNISFEFFPPKTPEGMKNLQHTAIELTTVSPEFFSVTFGAGGSTRDGTLQTMQMLQDTTTTPVAPHLACIGCTHTELTEILQNYKSLGVNRIVALRGDLPSGMGQSGELKFASELVSLIRETTGDHFHIEVAAYPEVHPQARDANNDIEHFKSKIDAGANSAITQYFFNADAYFYFLYECEKQGITAPITPGIMPITQFAKLVRFSDMCGAEIPRWIRKRLEAYHDDQESIKAFGIEVIHDLCQDLIAGGAPGLHFYTLNHFEASLTLALMLGSSTKASLLSGAANKDRIV